MTYERDGRIARITLDRPERGNGITLEMPRELADCVERANLDPEVHVIALAGNGTGLLRRLRPGGVGRGDGRSTATERRARRDVPIDPAVLAANHAPNPIWDPVTDFQMMSRNVRGFMSLFWSEKPVVCKVHGYCVAGGTDMALCSDLLVVEDVAKIGYPPARVWGVPTTALWAHKIGPTRAKRLLLTGDSISGARRSTGGWRRDWAPAAELDAAFESLLERVARIPINQLVMHKLQINSTITAQGLYATQAMSTFFDGIARHTAEGHEFVRRAAEGGFKEAVRERDEPFGDFGLDPNDAPSEGPDHQLADAVRARHGAPARRRRARGLRRRRLRALARQPLEVPRRPLRLPLGDAARPRRSSTSSSGSSARPGSTSSCRRSRRRSSSRPSASGSSQRGDDLRRPVRGAGAAARQVRLRAAGPRASACRSPRPSSPPPTPSWPTAIGRFDRYFGRAVFSRGGVDLLTNTGPLAGALDPADVHPTPRAALADPAVRRGRDGLHLLDRPRRDGQLAPDVPDPAPVAPLDRDPVRVDRRDRVAAADRADRGRARLHRPDLVRLPRHRRRAQLRRVQPAGDRRRAAAAAGPDRARPARPRRRHLPAAAGRDRLSSSWRWSATPSPTTSSACRRRSATSPGSRTPATAGTTRCRPSTRPSRSPTSPASRTRSTPSSRTRWTPTCAWDGEPIRGMSDADAKLLADLQRRLSTTAKAIPQQSIRKSTGSESRPSTKLWCHSSLGGVEDADRGRGDQARGARTRAPAPRSTASPGPRTR